MTILVLPVMSACSEDDSSRRPDTGYGRSQPPPAEVTCQQFCLRMGDCGEQLCIEDTGSQLYAGFGDVLTAACEMTCTDSKLTSGLNAAQWNCLFESSCREAIDYDVCSADASYSCH